MFQAALLREFEETSLVIEYLFAGTVLCTVLLPNKNKTNRQPNYVCIQVTCLIPSMYVIISTWVQTLYGYCPVIDEPSPGDPARWWYLGLD